MPSCARLLFLLLLAGTFWSATIPAGAVETTLTNAAQVRALTQAAAAQNVPVRLRGVVLGEAEPEGQSFTILDETAGLYLQGPPEWVSALRPGDLVEVEGSSDPGEFAPFVRAISLRVVGTAPIPRPRAVTFEQLVTGRLDAQWVEVAGIVRHWELMSPDRSKQRLEVATGGGRLVVQWNATPPAGSLVDAEVRVRGICFYQVNKTRQALGPLVLVPREVPLVVEAPAPADPYRQPASTIASLMQFAPQGPYGHRVHVHGIVTHFVPGRQFWIRDDSRGLRVQTRQHAELRPGDEVDVLGFLNRGDYTPVLEDAEFRKRASGPPPPPVRLERAQAAFDHDAALVELEADLVERRPSPDGWQAQLMSTQTDFRAVLRGARGPQPPTGWLPGSRVRVTGICSVSSDETAPVSGLTEPRSFQVLLRSAEDLRVVHPPPWWTPDRIRLLLATLAVVSLIAATCVIVLARWRLREQAARRARAESEFSAILAERNRMAREIHDTLAQGLGAISMQLELVKDRLKAAPDMAARHLESALQLARSSLTEARNTIWNMRSQVLENADLPATLGDILQQLTDDTGIRGQMQVRGRPRRLPPLTENNLLRIGQEAITNAARHAQPRNIVVELEFAVHTVSLRVTDDGRGFDPSTPVAGRGGFGLVGIRERATQLGGELKLHSQPGRGTDISLTLPVAR